MAAKIKLIVGLGNPGPEYANTRHNAGAWLIEKLAAECGETLRAESKFHGLCGKIQIAAQDCRLLLPTTFMNQSGLSVASLARFYRINADEILVAHDELDLPAGKIRFKQGGGHAGHNGLRDIIKGSGGNTFNRLRIGIGHPGHASRVLKYVLSAANKADQQQIESAIDQALALLPKIVEGDFEQVMQYLHT